jgi:hypothetical protein
MMTKVKLFFLRHWNADVVTGWEMSKPKIVELISERKVKIIKVRKVSIIGYNKLLF